MAVEVKAGETWKHRAIILVDGKDPDWDFKPADGLRIPSTDGHRKGLWGPNYKYVLISHRIDRGVSFAEAIFLDQTDPDALLYSDKGRAKWRVTPPASEGFDPQYPSNSLVVQLTEEEWVGWGEENTPECLRILKG